MTLTLMTLTLMTLSPLREMIRGAGCILSGEEKGRRRITN